MPELPLNQVLAGDCRDVLKTLPSNSFDSLVTDPPSGTHFMGKNWDVFKPSDNKKPPSEDEEGNPNGEEAADEEEPTQGRAELAAFQDFMAGVFKEVLRVMKPGAYGLVWALPRTSHHTAMALERAGFELKQPILHCFGSGFPKSHNVYKHLLKDPNVPPEVAERWKGYGTALKPAVEVWWLVRKPIDGTIIQNILKYGAGGLNIDGSRVPHANETDLEAHKAQVNTIKKKGGSMGNSWANNSDLAGANDVDDRGRWPSDLILSHSDACREGACAPDCPVGILSKIDGADRYFKVFKPNTTIPFFYTGKIKTSERKKGLESVSFINDHPTAKASKLMEYLVRLVSPAGAVVLDPFAGSGSTLVAAAELDLNFVGIERSEEYLPIIMERVRTAKQEAEERREKAEGFALIMGD